LHHFNYKLAEINTTFNFKDCDSYKRK